MGTSEKKIIYLNPKKICQTSRKLIFFFKKNFELIRTLKYFVFLKVFVNLLNL